MDVPLAFPNSQNLDNKFPPACFGKASTGLEEEQANLL